MLSVQFTINADVAKNYTIHCVVASLVAGSSLHTYILYIQIAAGLAIWIGGMAGLTICDKQKHVVIEEKSAKYRTKDHPEQQHCDA